MTNPYPRDSEIDRIETWDVVGDLNGLLDLVEDIWNSNFGLIDLERDPLCLKLITGGWSGNEDIVNALMRNRMFNAWYWDNSTRGGRYMFSKSEVKLKVKCKLVFDSWISPVTGRQIVEGTTATGKQIVDDTTAQAWLHSGCTFDGEIDIPEDENAEIKEFAKRGLKPTFWLIELCP